MSRRKCSNMTLFLSVSIYPPNIISSYATHAKILENAIYSIGASEGEFYILIGGFVLLKFETSSMNFSNTKPPT